MNDITHAIPAVILAGGHGVRMGTVDKCLLEINGRSILARIIETFAGHTETLLLNVNGEASRFKHYAIPTVSDMHPSGRGSDPNETSGLGPLAGILATLSHIEHQQPEQKWLLTLAGDCPFLPGTLAETLHAAISPDTEVMFCRSAGRDHFVIALWSTSIQNKLSAFLESGQRSVGKFIHQLQHLAVEFDDKPYDRFMNINTEEQLQRARDIAREYDHEKIR